MSKTLEKNLSGPDSSSIAGANWKNSQCYPNYRPSSATARLVWKNPTSFHYPRRIPREERVQGPYGTVVLIGSNIACSAGHCFDVSLPNKGSGVTPYSPSTGKQLAPQEFATLMSIQFGYELDFDKDDEDTPAVSRAKKSIRSFDITKLLEHRNGGLDYAVFEVSGNPGSIYEIAKIAIKEINFTVIIPQHPDGLSKKVGQGHAVCKDRQCRELKHYVDTLGGSSGSGIFYNGFLVGIHTHGDETENGGVSMIALFRASHVIQDIVLKDTGLFERYHDPSEFLKGLLLGALVAGGLGGLYSAFQDKYSTSKKALITAGSAGVGGIVTGMVMDKLQKNSVIKELSESPRYDGLGLS